MSDALLRDALLFVVIINPFAQMVYLSDLMNKTEMGEFRIIFLQATAMTLAICIFVAFVGDLILFRLFQVSLPAMRIFGGLINLSLAYRYVMHGPEGIKLFQGNVTEIAQQITLPVMVGAGVVWISMKIGTVHPPAWAMAAIATVLLINAGAILGYHRLFKRARGRVELAVIKYFGMAMRFNAMLIGAVSIEMIVGGTQQYLAMHGGD